MRFVITAGPTREHLDPVRFLSNPSTGKMGFALARAAARRQHDVTLIAGPVALKTPDGVRRIDVVSAREMLAASIRALADHAKRNSSPATRSDPAIFIATAAVADWRPAKCAAKKLKKRDMSDTLHLKRNPDILKTIRRRQRAADTVCIGFAAETDDVLSEAARKCREKHLAFIVANDVTEKGSGFGTDTNRVTLVFPEGTMKALPRMTKLSVARRIIRECEMRFAGKPQKGECNRR